MPTRDIIHDNVKNALIKDGWTITADPYIIAYDDVTLYADLGAERPLAAHREGRQIVVEIKSFLSPSPIFDLKNALGQYELYRAYLEVTAPERELFLAISHTVFEEFFQRPAIVLVVKRFQLALITVNLETEEIVAWTSS
ncbi:XisH family protein [Candidatus Entotheonella palauensis]|uniref:FdxN element excision controlling factor XisH-like protein n=1 Tax=Candidatus Entotheonella gemina TaxID=1429439 RepID=W4LWG7_9BACT|nr:XisH family protein [Candidatus Entotheonella palauensis]ETX02245.1 MAG: FdxN element excision controlling factor XisH-like protein [Candidatus Entotheonella gemina]